MKQGELSRPQLEGFITHDSRGQVLGSIEGSSRVVACHCIRPWCSDHLCKCVYKIAMCPRVLYMNDMCCNPNSTLSLSLSLCTAIISSYAATYLAFYHETRYKCRVRIRTLRQR